MRKIWNDFKTFSIQGNVLDMAAGVMIGGALGAVVNSIVNDMLMPPIGLLLHQTDFTNLFVNLSPGTYATLAEAKEAGVPTINYGLFLNRVVDFFIVSACVFFVVKQINRLREGGPRTNPSVPSQTRACPHCLSDIPFHASRCKYCTSFVRYDLRSK